MRTIVNYLRQVFCCHTFVEDEHRVAKTSEWGSTKEGIRVSLLCSKCGYHRSFWKYMK
jgi:hypothetical protein